MRWFLLLAVAGCGTSSAAPSDGGIVDGTSSNDVVVPGDDGGVDSGREASTGRWCDTVSPKPTFCDDFDVGDLGVTWNFFQQTAPGVGVHDEATFVSAPAAFGVRTKKCAQDETGTILLRKTIDGSASRAVLAFDMNADAVQGDGTLAIATLDLSTTHLLTLYLRDDDPNTPGPTLTEVPPDGGGPVRNPFTAVPAAAKWVHVVLDVDAANGKAVVTFDGAQALSIALGKGPVDGPTARLGVLVTGPAIPYTFDFDNVTFDVTP
jgi:hypothetical protein